MRQTSEVPRRYTKMIRIQRACAPQTSVRSNWSLPLAVIAVQVISQVLCLGNLRTEYDRACLPPSESNLRANPSLEPVFRSHPILAHQSLPLSVTLASGVRQHIEGTRRENRF